MKSDEETLYWDLIWPRLGSKKEVSGGEDSHRERREGRGDDGGGC